MDNYQRLKYEEYMESPQSEEDFQTYGQYKPDLLNAASLANESSVNYETYNEPDVYDVSALTATPPLEMTGPERGAQELTTRLRGYNEQLAGESEFRSAQEEAQGIPALTQTQQDLTNTLNTLIKENQAIPLMMQQMAQGRGMTEAGLRPLETGRLRQNAIQALSTSALLQAAQGNLTTAMNLVDRAVKQKYDPIREKISIAEKNLNLILQSPAYTLADKNRAQQQLQIQEAKKAEVANAEANDTAILNIATEAAKNGADALTLKRIQEAGSPEEALQIVGESGIYKEPVEEIETWSDPYLLGGDYVQQNEKTGEIRIAVNMPVKSGGTGGGGGGKASTNVSPQADDYLLQVIQNSKGGKVVDAETGKQITKAINVLGQLGDLQSTITDEKTGPILGILRSNNPYDVKAQLIKSELASIVPNLARGIYGEVGVLTDNDIKIYSQTLPNMKSPEQLRNLVLAMTSRTVYRAIANTLETQAALGRDVSGMENIFNRVKTQTESLESSFTGQEQAPTEIDTKVQDFVAGLNIEQAPSELPARKSVGTKIKDTAVKITNWLKGLF